MNKKFGLLMLTSLFLVTSCGLGDKISKDEFQAKTSSFEVANINDFTVTTKGSYSLNTSDFDNDCYYELDFSSLDITKESFTIEEQFALNYCNFTVTDAYEEIASYNDGLKYKYYFDSEKENVSLTAYYSVSSSGDYEETYDFEFTWNKYGFLVHCKEYVVLSDFFSVIPDRLIFNFDVTYTAK